MAGSIAHVGDPLRVLLANIPRTGERAGTVRVARTLMPEGVGVLSVEFKVNLLKPAAGKLFRAVGRVVRAGRTLTVCAAEVRAETAGDDAVIAVMQGTMMTVRGNGGVAD